MPDPVRNRIKAHRRVRAGDLVPHELNPRRQSVPVFPPARRRGQGRRRCTLLDGDGLQERQPAANAPASQLGEEEDLGIGAATRGLVSPGSLFHNQNNAAWDEPIS